MVPIVDTSPYGARAPNWLDRAVLAITRSFPANWLGLRLAILVRRITLGRLGEGALDIKLWGLRLRLYPRRNGCEKNALFTPQMFDVVERRVLLDAVQARLAEGAGFSFVDIGANVGLYTLFVAAQAGAGARILAVEPQPGIVDRLRYNLQINPQLAVEVMPIAVADRDGEIALRMDARDSGGTSIVGEGGPPVAPALVSVPCRRLAAVLADCGFARIDALKIDVEGAEDLVLAPFLREAPAHLMPQLILVEDSRNAWRIDLFTVLEASGYAVFTRSTQNVILRRCISQ
jgi:FkbM family methyltransferase